MLLIIRLSGPITEISKSECFGPEVFDQVTFSQFFTHRMSVLAHFRLDLAAIDPYCEDLGPIFTQFGPFVLG